MEKYRLLFGPKQTENILRFQSHELNDKWTSSPPWRNWLARSAVTVLGTAHRKVGGEEMHQSSQSQSITHCSHRFEPTRYVSIDQCSDCYHPLIRLRGSLLSNIASLFCSSIHLQDTSHLQSRFLHQRPIFYVLLDMHRLRETFC